MTWKSLDGKWQAKAVIEAQYYISDSLCHHVRRIITDMIHGDHGKFDK